jgi:hypothetical protein
MIFGYPNFMRYLVSAWVICCSFIVVTGCGPDRLQEVSNVTGLYIWGLDVDDEYLYVADATRGLVIFDISDPVQPQLIGELLPSNSGGGDSVKVVGQYAYLAAAQVLFVVDISNPSQPIEVGQAAGDMLEIAVQGDYVYSMGSRLFSLGLQIFDVSTPSAPVLVSELVIDASNASIAVSGDLVFVGDSRAGIHIIDVSNRAQPVLVGVYEAERIGGVAVEGDLVYAAGADGLMIIDIADPTRPRLRGCHATSCPPGIQSLSLQNGYAYVSGDDCLDVYDVSDTESPRLTAMLDAIIRIPYRAVVAWGGYIFLGHAGGLRIFPQES